MAKTSERTDWDNMREELHELHTRLQSQPQSEKLGFHRSFAGILNAYKEGDIFLHEAISELQALRNQPVNSAPDVGVTLESQGEDYLAGDFCVPSGVSSQSLPEPEIPEDDR